MNEAVITVVSKQIIEGETEESELICPCSFLYADGFVKIIYDYTVPDGSDTITSEIISDGDKVIINQKGSFSSRMEFCTSSGYAGSYTTPFGDLNMNITTVLLESGMNANGGKIRIEYSLEIAGLMQSFNEIDIEVTPGESEK